MTEIAYNAIGAYLEKTPASNMPRVCLIHGEPELVAQCAGPVIDHLVGTASREIHCEVIEGLSENIPDLLERLNTYALMAGPKVCWFREARLFDSSSRLPQMFQQIQEAFETDNIPRAAKLFLSLCATQGIAALDAAGPGQLPAELQPLQNALGEAGLRQLVDHIQDQGWSTAGAVDYVQSLTNAIEKGFPPGHRLLITTGTRVPKNRKFYKCAAQLGLVIDCHVPRGERKADKTAQEAVLREIADRALRDAGKKMNPGLLAQVVQLTGFDPATFRNNIEKLIDFSGPRAEISREDIDAVLSRSKSDPIYELTSAFAERNLRAALFFLNTLFNNDFHPLQVVAALANQVRKLLIAKDFTASPLGRDWHKAMPFAQFQTLVLPAVQQYDAQLAAMRSEWDLAEPGANEAKGGREAKKPPAELALAPNPGNAYPVYQTLLKSENYTDRELVGVMRRLGEADMRLKSSGQDPQLVVKHLVMTICS